MVIIASRVQIPFSFNYPSGGNLVPAASASVGVYQRNSDGSQGTPANVYQSQSGSTLYQSLQTDAGGNVPGWVSEGSYKVVAAATGGFGGGTVNFDALYGGGTAQIAAGVVDVVHFTANALAQLVPPGAMLEFAGSTPPTGYLLCDGSTYFTSAYPSLFSAIGYVHGGSGASFRVPDSRGRVPVGAGQGPGLSSRLLGQVAGEETHPLSVAELANHGHNVYDSGHGHSAGDNGHYHTTGIWNWDLTHVFLAAVWNNPQPGHTNGLYSNTLGGVSNYSTDTSYASIWIGAGTAQIQQSNAGSSIPHNNMQPYLAVNKIIKF